MAGIHWARSPHHTSCFDVKDILFERELKIQISFVHVEEKSNLKIGEKKIGW